MHKGFALDSTQRHSAQCVRKIESRVPLRCACFQAPGDVVSDAGRPQENIKFVSVETCLRNLAGFAKFTVKWGRNTSCICYSVILLSDYQYLIMHFFLYRVITLMLNTIYDIYVSSFKY
jgi:hypothetical protein